MNDAALLLRQVRSEQRSLWRNPASAFFTLVLPLVFLVIFASLFRNSRVSQLGNIPFDQYYVPALAAFGVMGATFTNLAITISLRRDSGGLKRLRATPLPRWVFFAGLIGSAILVALLMVVLTTAVGVLFYGLHFSGHYLQTGLVLAVGAGCFSALGIALTCLVPNADAAPAVVNGVFLPLVMISGTFFPVEGAPAFLRTIADVFPIRHFTRAVVAVYNPQGGAGLPGGDLLVLLAWGGVALLVALRGFRWEAPRS
ncbi:MAG: ABC transporter permease [Candidatus Dormibacteria bacterium]